MSENNNKSALIIPEPEVSTLGYDFNFIVQAMGLIPVKGGTEAINPGALTNIYRDEEDSSQWIFAFYGEETCVLRDSDMPDLEAQLRLRAETMRQMMQGGNLIAPPNGRRFRQ